MTALDRALHFSRGTCARATLKSISLMWRQAWGLFVICSQGQPALHSVSAAQFSPSCRPTGDVVPCQLFRKDACQAMSDQHGYRQELTSAELPAARSVALAVNGQSSPLPSYPRGRRLFAHSGMRNLWLRQGQTPPSRPTKRASGNPIVQVDGNQIVPVERVFPSPRTIPSVHQKRDRRNGQQRSSFEGRNGAARLSACENFLPETPLRLQEMPGSQTARPRDLAPETKARETEPPNLPQY
ncbi:hypothetical protein HRbin28_00278 [bacterium HR28]|jgi:hypothetical protein|nr:hypothetical protein HRbin28_00278 [bacterium HR28]